MHVPAVVGPGPAGAAMPVSVWTWPCSCARTFERCTHSRLSKISVQVALSHQGRCAAMSYGVRTCLHSFLPEVHVNLHSSDVHQQPVAQVLPRNNTSQPHVHNILRPFIALQACCFKSGRPWSLLVVQPYGCSCCGHITECDDQRMRCTHTTPRFVRVRWFWSPQDTFTKDALQWPPTRCFAVPVPKPETEQHLVVVCGLLNGEVKGTQLTVLYDRQREASLWSISSSSHRPYGQRPSNSFVNSSPNRMERRQHSADQISYKHDEVRAEFR